MYIEIIYINTYYIIAVGNINVESLKFVHLTVGKREFKKVHLVEPQFVQFPAIHFPSSKSTTCSIYLLLHYPPENEHIRHIPWKLMTCKMKSPNGPFSGMLFFGRVTLQVVGNLTHSSTWDRFQKFCSNFLDQSTRLPVVLVRIPKFSSSFSWARNYIIPIARSVHHFRPHTVDASKFPVLLLRYIGYMYGKLSPNHISL